EEHTVDVEVADELGRHVVDIGPEREGRTAAAETARPARGDRQVELGAGLGKVIKIVSVDMPRRDAQRLHACSLSLLSCSSPARRSAAWQITSAGSTPLSSHRTRCRRTLAGAQRSGLLPVERTTLGTFRAAARCDTPVSLQTSSRAPASRAASDPRVV